MNNFWLPRALEESRARGFLGPGPIEPHVEHASGFLKTWSDFSPTPPPSFLDLGSGGGLPGLVLLNEWRGDACFLDAMAKRTRFLEEVLGWPDAPEGSRVVTGRAEELARDPHLRAQFPLVVSRSFGPPAVTAECAAGFLSVGGLLIVSEPPTQEQRWEDAGLSLLGLEVAGTARHGATYVALRLTRTLDETYPRPNGVPGRKPLF